jgi:hypothetical protein
MPLTPVCNSMYPKDSAAIPLAAAGRALQSSKAAAASSQPEPAAWALYEGAHRLLSQASAARKEPTAGPTPQRCVSHCHSRRTLLDVSTGQHAGSAGGAGALRRPPPLRLLAAAGRCSTPCTPAGAPRGSAPPPPSVKHQRRRIFLCRPDIAPAVGKAAQLRTGSRDSAQHANAVSTRRPTPPPPCSSARAYVVPWNSANPAIRHCRDEARHDAIVASAFIDKVLDAHPQPATQKQIDYAESLAIEKNVTRACSGHRWPPPRDSQAIAALGA